jgi:hypothetical protein
MALLLQGIVKNNYHAEALSTKRRTAACVSKAPAPAAAGTPLHAGYASRYGLTFGCQIVQIA